MATFEESLARLEAIVEEMEGHALPLDRSLALFEEGIEQLRDANRELSRAEASVKVLTARADGVFEEVEFGS